MLVSSRKTFDYLSHRIEFDGALDGAGTCNERRNEAKDNLDLACPLYKELEQESAADPPDLEASSIRVQ